MKRIAIGVATVAVMLAAAGAAVAAINSYTANYSFSGGKGTAKKPASLSFKQTINVTAATAGERAGVLREIDTVIDGVKVDPSGFPTCTTTKIDNAGTDAGCPKKALIASGYINATLGGATNPAVSAGAACDPLLDVWNAGAGKLAFFFLESGSHQCLGGALHTGEVPAFPATYKSVGKNLSVQIPITTHVDYPVAGEVGSLSKEYLDWKSQTVNGHNDIESTGCSGSKRKYTFTFKASPINSAETAPPTETKSTSGSASCG